ncbi:response regulator [Paenibacillus yanchengensis]|uniref:Response regulator n=1 Tax=Paenibacillus yanchengensis TaxID=2035833 RepID=A0ABW4YF68_9BACL
MNVMIVDDEYAIRNHMALMLRGIDGLSVMEAANGQDALQKMELLLPNIVLTDIRMPVMDGMELIRQSQMRHPDVWFIVLSNFAEFELAQKAVEYGARSYLLKATITKDIVAEEVDRAILHLNKAAGNGLKFDPNEILMVQNSLFSERLNGHIHNAELLRRAERLSVSVFMEGFHAPSKFAVMEIDTFDSWTKNKFSGRTDLAIYALINLVRETIKRWNKSNELFHLGDNRFVVLDLAESNEERHTLKIENISNVTKQYLGLDASFLINIDFSGMDTFFQKVLKSRLQLVRFFYEKKACVVNAKHVPTPVVELDLYSFLQSVEGNSNQILQVMALPGLIETYFELLRHLCRPPVSVKSDIMTFIQFIEKTGFAVPAALKSEVNQLRASRLTDYKLIFIEWLGEMDWYGKHREEITKALAFIHDRYAIKLTLEDVCAHVNLSRSHLSKLFKEQQGVSVMKYIETYRLKQARLLLRTTSHPISIIIEMVGITDVFYFSKLYKKHFGINPSKDR